MQSEENFKTVTQTRMFGSITLRITFVSQQQNNS